MSSQKPTEIPFDPSTTPAELSSSLTELESALSPLLSREWSTQLEALTPLERAKTDVMVAYTIVDLMWIYLKMKGVDPATHDVSPELERVRAYYAKIHKIEYPEDSVRKYKVDVPAAGRFIRSGIPSAQRVAEHDARAGGLPESSAAAGAAAGRRSAMREQQESVERMGKAGRMRFVAQEAERVVLGDEGPSGSAGLEGPMDEEDEMGGEEGDDDEVEEEEEMEAVEVIEVDDNGGESEDFEMLDGPPGRGQRTPAEQAEALLADVEAGLAKPKRKRAEEF